MWLAVVALLAIHAGMLAWAATKHSPTIDEPGHLVAGISHWQFGRFELYRVNPPLVRMVAALPVLAVGCETDWGQFCDTPGRRCEFSVGRDFVTANGERSIRLFTLARWACIPFSLAGGLFCFLWAGELWGHYAAGLISLILWCFDPNILAHGELITTDCAAASLGLGAGYLFWRWLKCPTWGRAAAAGLVLGLAQLAKLSWLILFGLWPLLWLVWLCCQPQRAGKSCQHESRVAWPKQSAQLALILVMAVYLVNVAYGFQGSGTRLGKFTFLSHLMSGQPTGTPGNRFAGSWLGRLPTPLPEQYVLGIDAQRTDFEDYPVRSYLRGEWKEGGWWYYYLYALAVKMPHGTQLLLGMLVLFLAWPLWRRRHGVREDDADGVGGERVEGEGLCRDGSRPACGVSAADPVPFRHLIILLAPGIVLLALVSSQTEINLHFRYALPCFGFAFVLAGAAWLVLRSRRWLAVTAVSACLCWTVYAAVANHPHNLAYFNELAGGPANGHRHLLHSSLDWGQDMLALKAYLDDERFGAAAPGAHLYAMFEPADMGLRYVSLPEWVERRASESECSTADPRLVVSATYYHLAAADSSISQPTGKRTASTDGQRASLADIIPRMQMVENIGYSLYVLR